MGGPLAYKESKSTKEDRDLLVKCEGFFRVALDHPTWRSWRENAKKCFEYKEGEQWTAEEKGVLKDRNQPPSVNNQISVTINRLVGQFVKIKTRIGYRGRNYPQDEQGAQALTDIFLYIRQNSNLEFEERDMAEDGFTSGFGVLETYVTFGDDFQPEVKIRCEDPFTIFPDPYSRRYDCDEDAQYICRAKWVDVDEAKELYPEKASELGAMITDNFPGLLGGVDTFKNETYVDKERNRIRLVEVRWKEKRRESICLFGDGTIVNKDTLILAEPNGATRKITKAELNQLKNAGLPYHELDRLTSPIHVVIFAGGILLDHKETNNKYFGFIPYFVHRKKNGEPYSLVLLALPMQDQINKRESKALHLLNTNQAIFQANSVADKAELAIEKAKPDGMLEVRNIEQFRLERNVELAATQFNMHNQAKEDFRRITGINPDAMGEASEVRSGVGIARKVAMTDLIIAPIYDNLRRTRILLARNILELVQKYYTKPKLFYITDSFEKVKTIALNQDGQSIKQGIYDVVAEDMPDVTTLQQEQYQILMQTLPQILPFGPGWARFAVQLSDLRNKDDIIKQIEQQSQPPPTEPKVAVSAQLDALTAPERAFFYQKMGNPQLAQWLIQANVPTTAELKAKGDAGKESGKAEATMLKTATDLAKAKEQMSNEREKHQLDMEKTRLDVQAAAAKAAIAQQGGPNGGQRT